MILHTYFRSSAAYRVRIGLNLKGLAFEPRYFHLARGEHGQADNRAVNPQGFVPTLIEDGSPFIQSLAILEYLEETHPEPPLLPDTPAERAFVRALAQIVSADIHPLNNLRVLKYLRNTLNQDEAGVLEWTQTWIKAGFDALETMLAARERTGRFCYGDRPGLADCCLVPQVASAQRFKVPLDDYPIISAINAACLAMDEFAAAAPENQPDHES
jgi:maleylacetoacetate isomerase/maleylpyruvate isomerase